MKGFMHVVEILLVVVLVFIAFMQFTSIPSISGDWSETKLSLLSGDLLRTFETKGIDWFNQTELEGELNTTLPENIIYSVTLQNTIKPKIKLGCLCKGNAYSIVKSIFSSNSFVINGVNTSFEIINVSSAGGLFSLDFDVALIYGYEDLAKDAAMTTALKNFLNYDKGVIEIADIPTIDSVQSSIFGLGSNSTKSDSSGIIFSLSSMENGRETNKLYDYFGHIPVFYDSFANLDQWLGGVSGSGGNPAPSIELSGNDCNSQDTKAITRFYNSFRTGEIDFDVYLANGASLFIGFGKSAGYEYLASLSSNQTNGYDSFYRNPALQSIGSNTSHLTVPGTWNHIKIVVRMNEVALYNNGQKVATAQAAGLLYSNLSLFNKCGEANADNIRLVYGEAKEFSNFLENENTTQLNGNQNKILLVQKGTSLPACVINYNIEGIGKGRTAWLSNSTTYSSEDYKTLVKSIAVWASGDEYRIIKADIKKPVSSYVYKAFNKDMLQNVKIIIELGYLY